MVNRVSYHMTITLITSTINIVITIRRLFQALSFYPYGISPGVVTVNSCSISQLFPLPQSTSDCPIDFIPFSSPPVKVQLFTADP